MVRPTRIVALFLLLMIWGLAFGTPVDVNTADAKTLASALNGIGSAKAQAIIAYRQEHGPFRSVDDLAKVKGIGNKIIERNRAGLRVGHPGK